MDLDYYKDAVPAEMGIVGEYPTLPTVSGGGLAQITAVLDKLSTAADTVMKKIGTAADEASTTMADSRQTLKEIEQTAAALRKTLDSPEFTQIPADLRVTLAALEKSVNSVGPDGAVQGDLLRTLDELRASLRTMKSLMTTIDDKPNSLLFGRDSSGNPIPQAPKGKR